MSFKTYIYRNQRHIYIVQNWKEFRGKKSTLKLNKSLLKFENFSEGIQWLMLINLIVWKLLLISFVPFGGFYFSLLLKLIGVLAEINLR